MNKVVTQLYGRLPVPFQDLAVSFYGLRLRHREYGRKFDRLQEQFERQQWFSLSEMEAYQNEHLRSIVAHAYHTVPFYKTHFDSHNLHPSDIKSIVDIEKIPVLDSEVLVKHGNELISTRAGRCDRIVGHTSGTTGYSKSIIYDRRVCLIKNVVDWRLKALANIDVGESIAHFMGQSVVSIEQRSPPFWRLNKALNHLFFSAFHFSPKWYDSYIDALQDYGVIAIDGYPSTASMFGEALLARNRSHQLKAAFVSSEMLLPYQRKSIEQAFKCPVFDYYGMAERAVFATECELHRGLHLNSDFGVCELVDEYDRPVAPGSSGRIVVTGLHNYTMPFIRLKTNDWATMSPEPCPCGRPFPLLKSIDGRQEDMIATPDGRYLDVTFTYDTFESIQPRIVESQILQEESGEVIVKIVPTKTFCQADSDQLIRGIGCYMGPDARIRVQICDNIPRTKSGKFRWLVSKVPRQIS